MSRGLEPIRRVLSRAARPAALLALALLASCGGGDRVSTFRPTRMVVFGDENNVIVGPSGSVVDVAGTTVTAQPGAKYTVNALALNADGTPAGGLACSSNPLWFQVVAGLYGFGFAECNPYTGSAVAGFNFSRVGARVGDVAAQVTAANAALGGFTGTDLVMVMVGQRDILEAYANYPAQSDAAVVAAAEAAGRALGNQVNAIAAAGGKVLIATVPNQATTPFAYAQNLLSPERSGVLQRMSERFNAAMRATIVNDGTKIGLVQADEQVQLIVNNQSIFGYVNGSSAACTTAAPLPNCTTSTLVPGATSANYVWADDLHLNVDMHIRIGNIGSTRATNNPF
ncbi:MAG TPA: SGNH/GDSL hydrolase family protein [Methylibium sp.]|uniref:SGNH/GDSL hydrolase family protein n=1 Tax=Methylibium sp. TaxID=2067992 RepID=UPI002DBE8B67|nr:SGNH/GDSL hydrolase family protein [Methylibium sp.]HEU4458736.1 SGNH/GDSL hydrolase family protein [Methylibium sp.]